MDEIKSEDDSDDIWKKKRSKSASLQKQSYVLTMKDQAERLKNRDVEALRYLMPANIHTPNDLWKVKDLRFDLHLNKYAKYIENPDEVFKELQTSNDFSKSNSCE